ncbi:nodal homolog [Haliotis cracherodii]|uniref:nodal homolog n=1 Tax=Haliotis cracherodii TaxID=6455 RepID=UPI0039EAC61C
MSQCKIAILFLTYLANVGARRLASPKQWLNQEFQVKPHTYRNEGKHVADISPFVSKLSHTVDYQKDSTKFLVRLFNILQKGAPLAKAAGRKLKTADLMKVDTIRSFAAKDMSKINESSRFGLSFKIPSLPQDESLRLAEFRCPRALSLLKKYKVKISIFKGEKIARKVTIRVQPTTHHKDFVFDISRAITAWVNGYHGDVTIHVEMPRTFFRLLSKTTSEAYENLLVLYLENQDFLQNVLVKEQSTYDGLMNSASRGKRSAPDIIRRRRRKNRRWNKAGKKQGCRLYDFDVDFNTIGWGEWIIHPTRFNSKFCHGNCPSPIDVRHKPTNHAMLQSLMRSKRSNVAPSPCCVPTKLEPLSMMYVEDGEVVVRHHEDMIASECGCR